MSGQVAGILLDLGVSSPQLDEPQRGFSFTNDGPLDMRMDPTVGETAAEWLAHAHAEELAEVFRRYGEERFARRIARAIVVARESAPLERTLALAQIVARELGVSYVLDGSVQLIGARSRALHALLDGLVRRCCLIDVGHASFVAPGRRI